MKIQKSAEDYLEAMLMLRERNGYIRSVDVAVQLNVTKPSVSYAVKRLRESGYIDTDENGLLHLLPAGEAIAQEMYTRQQVLSEFLIALGVADSIARRDACKIEHDLSIETFNAICRHIGELKASPSPTEQA